MNIITKFSQVLSKNMGINYKYIELLVSTILVLAIIAVIKKIGSRFIHLIKNDRKEFIYNTRFKLILNILLVLCLFFVWEDYIESLITLISFLSAAIAFALRDIILNWFCGIYNRIKKIFKIEDRIEIDGIKGDVINISTLGFEILEINEKEENGQSTGVFVNYPNSVIFQKPIKNITKGFKYIWNEMTIKVALDNNIANTKKELYRIINSIEEIKNTPRKMKKAVSNINAEYRIYFNQYDPMIYTKIVDNHVELTLRFLVNPKKARFIESKIWNQIFLSIKSGKIVLLDS